MKKNLSIVIACCSLGLFIILLLTGIFSKRKIAYVRSSEIVNNYWGMQEARNAYQEKTKLWQTNIDTLESDLQKAISKYNTELTELSKEERIASEQYIQKQKQNLVQYSEAIKDKAKLEDEKITQGVLNQINSFVEEYGEEHGYDIIMGTTLSGNILYGKKELDITEEVLEGLNKSYKGNTTNTK